MEIRELTYFIAVAEDLSFTKAARRLQMSQPPLSQAMTRLEERLGTRLFERRARTAPRLTPAGRLLLDEAKRIIHQVRQAEALLDSVVADVHPLRIGSASSILAGLLPEVVRTFRKLHPDVRLLVEEREEASILGDMRQGSADLGFARVRTIDEDFEMEFFGWEPLVCVLPDDHPLADRDAVDLADVAGEDFVCFDREAAPQAHDRIISACVRAGFTPRIPLRADNDLSILSTVACGSAVAIMPHTSSYTPVRGVRFVGIADAWAATPLAMFWRSGQPNPLTAAFADQVRTELVRRRDRERAAGRRTFDLTVGRESGALERGPLRSSSAAHERRT